MIETIRKWNEIDDYNLVLKEIRQKNKDSLRCLYDTYSKKFYNFTLNITQSKTKADRIVCNFFINIYKNPNDYEMTDGNVDVELFLINKLRKYIENNQKGIINYGKI